jgi:hypothetical protein
MLNITRKVFMNKRVYAFLAGLVLLSCGCTRDAEERGARPTFMFWNFRKEIVSDTYRVPDMKTRAAADYLQRKIQLLMGYVDSTYDLDAGTITVRYQSTIIRKMNIEEAIALAGFAVNDRPARPGVQLPPGVK